MGTDEGFLARWSRRKVQLRQGQAALDEPAEAQAAPAPLAPTPQAPAVPAPAPSAALANEAAAAPELPPPPTLDDVARLPADAADFSRFVAPRVDPVVRNAAMKKLFSDPHFQVMDGLDVYIDDYSQPDPLPAGMLRKLAQSQLLGLFNDEPEAAPVAGNVPTAPSPPQDHDAHEPVAAPALGEPDAPAPPAAQVPPEADLADAAGAPGDGAVAAS